ncbi:MAG TPA: STAS domain-containing protein, partial [Nannocystis sp.]
MTDAEPDDRGELYEEAPCGLILADAEATIVTANRTFVGWLGYSAQELAGRRFQTLLTVPGALLYETHCAPLLRLQGHVGELSLELLARDRSTLPVLLTAVVRTAADGAKRLQIAVFQAPTRREYERELQQARRKAEETAELLHAQAELLAEHSALLIPIQDGLRVMPVLGTIDGTRGQQMIRALLELDASRVRVVLIDLTGVPSIDAAAAETLRQAAAGVRLRGVRPILTGIRPAVASALVSGGVELQRMLVCGTLQDGIAM